MIKEEIIAAIEQVDLSLYALRELGVDVANVPAQKPTPSTVPNPGNSRKEPATGNEHLQSQAPATKEESNNKNLPDTGSNVGVFVVLGLLATVIGAIFLIVQKLRNQVQ